MADDVILNKVEIIENCLRRIDEIYQDNADFLRKDQTKQDAILLNLERACQAAIDMAMRVVRLRRLGLPKESREAFTLLENAGLIDAALCRNLHGLVGFRNTAIHNYQKLDLNIVESIIQTRLGDFRDLCGQCLRVPPSPIK